MSEIIAPSAAELEALKAAVQRFGHTVRAIECNMVEAFAVAGRAALAAAYPWHGKPPAWLPLTPARRTDPTIGRKRRARRARGRRIEARQALGHGHWFRVQLDPSRPSLLELGRKIHVLRDEVDSFPTGELTVEQWAAARQTMQGQKGEAHEADQDPR